MKSYLRPSVSIAIFSKHLGRYRSSGLTSIYNGKSYQNYKEIDIIFEETRVFVKVKLLSGRDQKQILANENSLEYIKFFIKKQYFFRHKTPICSLSYAVFNGFNIPQGTEYILLTSDGYSEYMLHLAKVKRN